MLKVNEWKKLSANKGRKAHTNIKATRKALNWGYTKLSSHDLFVLVEIYGRRWLVVKFLLCVIWYFGFILPCTEVNVDGAFSHLAFSNHNFDESAVAIKFVSANLTAFPSLHIEMIK